MMKSAALILSVVCLAGCGKLPPKSNAQTSVATVVTDYSSEGNDVTLLNGEGSVSSLPGPNDADRAYTKQLSKNIKAKVIAFVGGDLVFEAARPYGNILLLDVSERDVDVSDGNLHIVYDLKRKTVIGYFVWYMQG